MSQAKITVIIILAFFTAHMNVAGNLTQRLTAWCKKKNTAADAEKDYFDCKAHFERFIAKHAPPKELQELIDNNKEAIAKQYYGLVEGITPPLFLKGNDINRVINAERMRQCIKKNNLHLLDVAKKYIYQVDGQWKVFAHYVKENDNPPADKTPLTLVQQLAILAEETGFSYWGFSEPNWIFDETGKLVCIDTENNSFAAFAVGMCRIQQKNIPHDSKLQYVLSLGFFKDTITPEAWKWLEKRINTLLNSKEGTKKYPTIVENNIFDDPAININKVKKHFTQLIQSSLSRMAFA